MWNGKKKCITFSYDDGIKQDVRLIALMNKYGIKATFNINSGLLGTNGSLSWNGYTVDHSKNDPNLVKEIYKNHEVAVHTLHHPNLTELSEEEIIKEVEEDRIALSKLTGEEIIGMAYPCGGVNNDDRVAQIIKEKTGVKYSRTITSSHKFDLPKNFYRFDPTVYHGEVDKMFELAKKFIEMKTDEPQLLYIWGHSYELDNPTCITWEQIEELFKLVSGRDDIFYATNKEAFNL